MKKVIISQEKYQCLGCLELYDTPKQAENCRKIDFADGFSKLFAWLNRQKVLKI